MCIQTKQESYMTQFSSVISDEERGMKKFASSVLNQLYYKNTFRLFVHIDLEFAAITELTERESIILITCDKTRHYFPLSLLVNHYK